MKQIIICIDGLPHDLFTEENMPFLYNYAKQNHFIKLQTLFAFTGLEYSFFTGKTPDQTGIWMEFLKSDCSIFNSRMIKLFSFSRKLRYYAAAFVQLLHKRTWLSSPHNIPNEKLKYFDTSAKNNVWELDFFKNKKFAVYKWPFFVTEKKKRLIFKYESDKQRLKRLFREKDKEVYYVQLMGIDKAIHKFGKESDKTRLAIKKLDNALEKHLEKNANVIIWSDHGFMDIKENIDLQSLLPKSDDYLAFYAGTTAHFWFKNKKIKEFVINILKKQKFGFILTDTLKKIYNIPLSTSYGEIIFAMNPGFYIFPNYYQEKPFKSMHGYPVDKADLSGILISNKEIPKMIKIQNILEALYG